VIFFLTWAILGTGVGKYFFLTLGDIYLTGYSNNNLMKSPTACLYKKNALLHNPYIMYMTEQIPRIRYFVTSNSMTRYHVVGNKSLKKNLGI
jgi:hypothetical protein